MLVNPSTLGEINSQRHVRFWSPSCRMREPLHHGVKVALLSDMTANLFMGQLPERVVCDVKYVCKLFNNRFQTLAIASCRRDVKMGFSLADSDTTAVRFSLISRADVRRSTIQQPNLLTSPD